MFLGQVGFQPIPWEELRTTWIGLVWDITVHPCKCVREKER
jgi:hypothetical protein